MAFPSSEPHTEPTAGFSESTFEEKYMAPSFSNVKTVSAFVSSRISSTVRAQGGVSNTWRVLKNQQSQEPTKISWIPDPVTGYYRPENKPQETDAVELRRILVKDKTRRH